MRCYTAPPIMPDTSDVARRQMRAWATRGQKNHGRAQDVRDAVSARCFRITASRRCAEWRAHGRGAHTRTWRSDSASNGAVGATDRANPLAADIPNQAINHASVAVTSAAVIAVISVGAIPQLGFIHEHSGDAFALDIADLYRDSILLPAAFKSARAAIENPGINIERHTRRATGQMLKDEGVIPNMIDRIKTLFEDIAPLEETQAGAGDIELLGTDGLDADELGMDG